MKKKTFYIGPGAASLLLVIVAVSMSVLGVLALVSARSDMKLTERSRDFVTAEYEACADAERTLAQLDGILAACAEEAESNEAYLRDVAGRLPGGMRMEDGVVSWEATGEMGRTLFCAVEIQPLGQEDRYVWKKHLFASDSE